MNEIRLNFFIFIFDSISITSHVAHVINSLYLSLCHLSVSKDVVIEMSFNVFVLCKMQHLNTRERVSEFKFGFWDFPYGRIHFEYSLNESASASLMCVIDFAVI